MRALLVTSIFSLMLCTAAFAHTGCEVYLIENELRAQTYARDQAASLDRIELVPSSTSEEVGWSLNLPGFFSGGPVVVPKTAPIYGVRYRNQDKKGIVAAHEPTLSSYRYYPEGNRFPPGAQVALSLLHGFGAEKSHSQSFLDALPVLTDAQNKTQQKVTAELEKQSLRWIPVAAEALDLPESGNGHVSPYSPQFGVSFGTLGSTCRRFDSYFVSHRRASGGLLNVAVSRSAAVGLAGETNARHKKAIDAQILIGPLHPDPALGFAHSVTSYESRVREGVLRPNRVAFDWVNAMYAEMRWHQASDPFFGKSTLILVGEFDVELSAEARNWFREIAARLPHVRYVEIPGAGHDVLLSTRALTKEKDGTDRPSYSPVPAYLEIQKFLNALVAERAQEPALQASY